MDRRLPRRGGGGGFFWGGLGGGGGGGWVGVGGGPPRSRPRVCRWVWKELTSDEARRWSKRMVLVLIAMVMFDLATPMAIRYIFDGLVGRDLPMIYLGFGGFLLCLGLWKTCQYYNARAREIVIGTAIGDVDRRITELFFEKSMGQHLQESSSLNTANIEKGRSRVVMVIEMLLFQGIEVIVVLLLSFVFLCVLSPVAGLVMGVVIAFHLGFSLYLNKKVVEECTPIERDFRRLNRHRVERWDKMERVKTCCNEAD
jgi:ABC-type bacteriocin/lantibiotic exporter with double-glycine peptidase domain